MQWFILGWHTRCPPYCVVIWYSHGDPGAAAMFGSQSLCGPHSRSVLKLGCPAVAAAAGGATQHSPASANTAPSATALIPMRPPGGQAVQGFYEFLQRAVIRRQCRTRRVACPV